MMHRTQISLDPTEHRRARERASELGVSLAEYIRQLIHRDLDEPEATVDVSVLFNLGTASEPSDIARYKDEYIGEAFDALRRRTLDVE
jgi:hypothetical protein